MTKRFVSLIALAAATPALAQSVPATDGHDDSIVVTASRSGEGVPISQVAASVTLLDAQALQTRQTRIVSDILRDVPGVAVNRTGAIGGLTQIRIRGTEGNHVLVLIDGIEAADPYYGEYDFGTLIADPEAKIEVLRGQQSSLYGSDAIGGVIQYITLTGAEAPGYSLRAEGGSFGTYTGSARAAGVTGDLDYAVSGAYYHTRGTPTARGGAQDIGSDSVGASAKLIWSPSEAFKLTGVARYSYTDADTNETGVNGTNPYYITIDAPGEYFRNNAFYGLLRAEFIGLDGRWTTALSGQIADTTRKGYTPAGFDYGDKGQRYKGSLTSSIRFGTDTVVHRVTGAVDVEREQFQNISPASAFAFNGKRHTDNIGIVGEYELLVNDALSLGGSVRRDENNRFDDTTTWRAQGSYSFATGTRIRGAYGTGVKNPGYYELYGYSDGDYIGNPNLKPEKSQGWEVGLEQTLGGNSRLGAAYFDSKLKNEIYTTYPAPDFIATPGNRTTDSKQKGVEVFVEARPIPQIQLNAAYTYLKAREDGVVEVRRPKHVASFNATVFSKDERFSGTLTLRYNGRQTDTAFAIPFYTSMPVSLREYVLVNLNADYKISDGVSIFGRVENLANEDYEEVYGYTTTGRAAYGGVKVRF
jgi:vitamin B12 transporter